MVKKKHNKDKKLHNSDIVHEGPDLAWQERVDLGPEDEVERGSDNYYFTDEDGSIHSREFLAEELIPDDVEGLEASLNGKRRHDKVQRLKPGAVKIVNLVPASGETQNEISLPVPKSGARPLDVRISSEVSQTYSLRKSRRAMDAKRTGKLSSIFKIAQVPMSLRALPTIIMGEPRLF